MHGTIPLNSTTVFPTWHILLAEPNREKKSADWLKMRNLSAYWPSYTKQMRQRGHLTRAKLFSCIPGYLFIPERIVTPDPDTNNWQIIRDTPGIRSYVRNSEGKPAVVTHGHIEVIRQIEAKLNLPPEAKGVLFKVGDMVSVKNDEHWGWEGPIVRIDSEARICVEVQMLGCACRVFAPASELEAI